jgi:hypothetical protein
MALNFPSTPSANATYTYSGKSWTYNGNAWALTTATLSTSVVPEGTNLYFTNARATAAVTNTSLSNLTLTGNVSAGNVTINTGGVLTFPDGSRQTTAASVSGTLLNIITRSSNVGITLQNRTFSVQGRSSNTTITVA